ncbi:HdeD family acid-resistance protein [Blautia sp. HCP3S3_H10_1]|uniref:HdeD family acid-resistance protein n=1 Tax=unclassified Blautia TaxID=2648079 RepID=UPI003F92D84F|nr:DUF308 domain-containing protein [Clostridia bacterium]
MRRRSRYGWLELIEGILLILLGIYTLFNPGDMIRGITFIYGILAVITGISDIVFYAKTERYIGFGPTIALVSGILSILAGLMLLMYPNAGELIMTLLLPIWFIAHSVSRLTHLPLVRLAGSFFYYFTMIVNIMGIILGCLMIIWPAIALFSAGFIIGFYLILLGIDSVVIACSDMDAGWM